MSLELREARLDDFGPIHANLLVRLNEEISETRWRRLFEPGWETGGKPAGYALWKEEEPVGFLATLHRPPPTDGRSPICNLSSWIVLEEHRGSALRLLGPVLARQDWTLVNLSPTPEVAPIFRGLGFEPLETRKYIVPVRPDLPLRPGPGGIRVRWGAGEAVPEDHAALLNGVEVVRKAVGSKGEMEGAPGDPSMRSVVTYSVRSEGRVRSIRLHSVPDARLLRLALPRLWRGWLARHRAPVVVYDARILEGLRLPFARVREMEVPRLFRSSDRTAADLGDEHYTEMVLLEL
ncbi:MAG: hypothetical protein EA351_08785 [Gemmatimonadales bacterium]|nr:MAG: hypothetical protein EA351_08785 [Gemmatimonadales bacterium]